MTIELIRITKIPVSEGKFIRFMFSVGSESDAFSVFESFVELPDGFSSLSLEFDLFSTVFDKEDGPNDEEYDKSHAK